MKISNGFVTNSSSTSYVLSCKNGLTKDSFMAAFGVCEESLLYDIYEKLYYTLQQTLKPIPQNEDIDFFLESIQIKDASDKEEIKKRYLDGETVFHGELSDSGDYGGMIEAFYSHESLVAQTDKDSFVAYDDVTVRRLVECITVSNDGRIVVTLKGGFREEEII